MLEIISLLENEIMISLSKEIESIKQSVKEIVVIHGKDASPEDVANILLSKTDFIEKTKGEKGDQGVPAQGNDGKNGKDAVITEKIKKEIADKIKVPIVEKIIEKTVIEKPVVTEVAVTDKPIVIADKLNTLTEKVDRSVIKGLDKWMESIKIALRERKTGGGSSGGGGMGNVVTQSTSVSSATTTITLSNKVASGGKAIWLNYNGQQQAYSVHFTVSGKTISLLFTPQDGTFVDIIYIRS